MGDKFLEGQLKKVRELIVENKKCQEEYPIHREELKDILMTFELRESELLSRLNEKEDMNNDY